MYPDQERYAGWLNELRPSVRPILRRLLRDSNDRDDVFQDAVIRLTLVYRRAGAWTEMVGEEVAGRSRLEARNGRLLVKVDADDLRRRIEERFVVSDLPERLVKRGVTVGPISIETDGSITPRTSAVRIVMEAAAMEAAEDRLAASRLLGRLLLTVRRRSIDCLREQRRRPGLLEDPSVHESPANESSDRFDETMSCLRRWAADRPPPLRRLKRLAKHFDSIVALCEKLGAPIRSGDLRRHLGLEKSLAWRLRGDLYGRLLGPYLALLHGHRRVLAVLPPGTVEPLARLCRERGHFPEPEDIAQGLGMSLRKARRLARKVLRLIERLLG